MRVPLYLAVAQWALLFALGALVVILYRQLGRALGLPVDTTGSEVGPAVGSAAPEFDYTRLADGTRQSLTPGGKQPVMVAFVDPTCPACEDLVDGLGAAADAGELSEVRVLLVTSEPADYLQISETFRATRLEVGRVIDAGVRRDYHVSATPLLVAIDGAGVVRAAGLVRDRNDVRAFRQSCLAPTPELPAVSTAADRP